VPTGLGRLPGLLPQTVQGPGRGTTTLDEALFNLGQPAAGPEQGQ